MGRKIHSQAIIEHTWLTDRPTFHAVVVLSCSDISSIVVCSFLFLLLQCLTMCYCGELEALPDFLSHIIAGEGETRFIKQLEMHAECIPFLLTSAFSSNSLNALTLCMALAVVYRWVLVKILLPKL